MRTVYRLAASVANRPTSQPCPPDVIWQKRRIFVYVSPLPAPHKVSGQLLVQ